MKIVLYGANSMTAAIAAEFFEDHDVIVIDPNQKNLETFSNLDIGVICADALNIKVLKETGLNEDDCFIALSDNDETNIIACLMARQIASCQTICFVRKKETLESINSLKDEYKSSYLQEIEHVIWPQKLLMQEIFKILTVPEALLVENFAKGKARLFEYRIKEEGELAGKKLKDCYFNSEVLVAGIVKNDELIIPNGDSEFCVGDKAILIGTPIGLDIAASELFSTKGSVKNVAIIGGGSVGYELAQSIEKTKTKLKLIEINYKRCEFLSQNLKRTLILNGSGTNPELLNEEEINKCDVVIAITNNDEKNLLCSLLAKQTGAKKVITRVGEGITAKLFEHVGIDVAISARSACVNEIKNRIIESRAGVIATVERGQGEIIELDLKANFEPKPLYEIKKPANCVVAIIKRGSKVIIPKGKTVIQPLDTLLIFTKAQDAQSVREFFK